MMGKTIMAWKIYWTFRDMKHDRGEAGVYSEEMVTEETRKAIEYMIKVDYYKLKNKRKKDTLDETKNDNTERFKK